MFYISSHIPGTERDRSEFEFATSNQLFDAMCKEYDTSRYRTVFTWKTLSSYEVPGGHIAIYQVQIKEGDFHEFFTVVETDNPLPFDN